MEVPRRELLRLAAGAAALPFLQQRAFSETYPSRPLRMIVPFPAGSAPDIIARLAGQWLSDGLGQPVIVDNRPGAASNIGTEVAARGAGRLHLADDRADQRLQRRAVQASSLNFVTDVTHVAGVANAPYVVIGANTSGQRRSVHRHAKSGNFGKINFASGGKGSSSQHLR